MTQIELTPEEQELADKQNDAIKGIYLAKAGIYETVVGTPEYFAAVDVFEEAVTSLARTHRNWNDITGEPDGMYDYMEDEVPEGAESPAVPRDELTTIEELSEDILYSTRLVDLKKPSLKNFYEWNRIIEFVSDLTTYHPEYNERNGELGG